MTPSGIPDADASAHGLMTAAHFTKLDALMSAAAEESRLAAIEGDVSTLETAVGALAVNSHVPATVAASPVGWLSIVGQALTFALVAATDLVAGVVSIGAQTFAGAKTFINAVVIGGTLQVNGRITGSDGASITGRATGAVVSITSAAASLPIDMSTANNFSHTLTENTTLAAPTTPIAGQSGVIVFTQHASSPKTLAFNAFWKFAGGTVPTLTATNGAVDVFAYYVESGTRATCSLIKDVK